LDSLQVSLQAACQRYRQTIIDAKTPIRDMVASAVSTVKSLFAPAPFATALV